MAPQSPLASQTSTPGLRPPSSVEITRILPDTDQGRFAIKREVGDRHVVTADIFREGHDALRAVLQHRNWYEPTWHDVEMRDLGNDLWSGEFECQTNGRQEYRIVAFPDPFETWRHGIRKKLEAGVEITSDLLEGRTMVSEAIARFGDEGDHLQSALDFADGLDDPAQAHVLLSDSLLERMRERASGRDFATVSRVQEVFVDRVKARYSTWYEVFPRSTGTPKEPHGTFGTVIDRLDDIAAMGFDVLYFPPIHPIGEVNRKGKNNAVHSEPGDPGVPYAIGSRLGGHDAIDPKLGSLEDFHRLVEAARSRGIEIALDFAIQAAPDHPWATEHPEWFTIGPDGLIKFAENPPKKYEDIYPINFASSDWFALWQELRRIVLYWIDQGVTIFRVDNPHTKPIAFWRWLIREVQEIHPETLFLSEAFTRPKVMQGLAQAGFSQSYSYFTWRNGKQELTDYLQELTNPPVSDFMRANFFANTPDILPWILQEGGKPAFRMRAILAATLSSSYGIFSGFEFCENESIPGKEEYANSDKYEVRVRDWNQAESIKPLITRLNAIRRSRPTLQEYDNLEFHWAASDAIIVFSKRDSITGDALLVVVNLDPYQTQDSMIWFPLDRFGVSDSSAYFAHDLLSGDRYTWTGSDQYVRLDPALQPGHVLLLSSQSEVEFPEISG